jgi:hypothetical protein
MTVRTKHIGLPSQRSIRRIVDIFTGNSCEISLCQNGILILAAENILKEALNVKRSNCR